MRTSVFRCVHRRFLLLVRSQGGSLDEDDLGHRRASDLRFCKSPECRTDNQVRVIDGDTIRVFNNKRHFRLVGFNAPDTRRAQCEVERALGDKATRRVRDLVRDEPLDFKPVRCSCKAGTEGEWSCNYGRPCGTLIAGGKDVGDILIAEGLAMPFKCSATSCPKTPSPWCEARPKS